MAEIESYLRARKNFGRISGEIEDLALLIVEVGEILRDDPANLSFDNAGIPIAGKVSRIVDAEEWKTAQEIQEMLAHYHDAKNAMYAGWEKVPTELRDGLLPPFESLD